MANLALGRRIIDNLLEFTHKGFSMIAFKVVNTKIIANMQNKEHKKHD